MLYDDAFWARAVQHYVEDETNLRYLAALLLAAALTELEVLAHAEY